MLLTTKGRYAVMAMIDLAYSASLGAPVNLSVVATRQEIDKGYLEQIFIKLKAANLVVATRGPGGGYKLAKTAKEISIAHIMMAVEEDFKMTRCSNHSHEGCMSSKQRCVSHHLWERLENHIVAFLEGITLAELMGNKKCDLLKVDND